MSEAEQVNKQSHSQWVTFHMEGETYGVNVMQVQEVLRATEIAPVPGAPNYVLGIINLRGNVVTVLDIRKRFGLEPRQADESTRIIIVESQGQTTGMMVDSVAEVEDVETEEIDIAPNVGSDDASKYIDGVVNRDKSLLILVNVDRVLEEEEWNELRSF